MVTDDGILGLVQKRLKMFGYKLDGTEEEESALLYSIGLAKQHILNFCNICCIPNGL